MNTTTPNFLRLDEPRLLIIEKSQELGNKLKASKEIKPCRTEDSASKLLKEPFPDVVLISSELEWGSGVDFCGKIKKNPETAHIPVMIIVDKLTDQVEIQALNAGASDVVARNASREVLKLRIDRLAQKNERRHRVSTFLKQVDQEIFNHLTANFHVVDLAKQLQIDRKTLYRRLKSESGLTPQLYIRRLRLSRAGFLLKKGVHSVSEVSFQVGFKDVSYFTKCFKRYFDKLPSEFLPRER